MAITLEDPLILAFDLGTGGAKISLHDSRGRILAATVESYATTYPRSGWHEQRPEDWWRAVVTGTRRVLALSGINPGRIAACGVSGHSLGVVPVAGDGTLLRESTPIWSDARAQDQARRFFTGIDAQAWYLRTGGGFPPALYPLFKLMWYQEREPGLLARAAAVVGTKDYVNLRLTGRIATDHSYASGSGAYDLECRGYADELIAAAGLPRGIFPEVVASTAVLGCLTKEAAGALGLPITVQVVAGGVDNACMALGARLIAPGRTYGSLGSSAWIAVCSQRPLLDLSARPYVFAHVLPGMFISSLATFAAGSSLRWVRDHLCPDLVDAAAKRGLNAYDLMADLAAESPPGARRLLFQPGLAGAGPGEGGPDLRGGFLGLDLSHGRADLIRAAMEGVALDLRSALDRLRGLAAVESPMLMVGSGSRSALWRRIHADVLGLDLLKSGIDDQAAALGAAALAALGLGWWADATGMDQLHQPAKLIHPDPVNARLYDRMLPIFAAATQAQARLGASLAALP